MAVIADLPVFCAKTSRGGILARCNLGRAVIRGRLDYFTDEKHAQCKTNVFSRCEDMYSTITTIGTTCDAEICDAGVLCCQKRQMDCAGPQPNDVMRTPKTTDDMPGGVSYYRTCGEEKEILLHNVR